MSTVLFLRGSCTVAVSAPHRTAAMNLCMQMGLQYRSFQWQEDGSIRICCSAASARRLVAACQRSGIDAKIVACRGLPRFLAQIGQRAGLMVGAVLALALIVLSGLFVWDVQVEGNVSLTEGKFLKSYASAVLAWGVIFPTCAFVKLKTVC